MRNVNYKIYKYFLILFVLTLGILFGKPAAVHAADSADDQDQVVRVAYLLSAGYQEGGDGEYKTGQGYEYLQKIAGYTGWKYEYVYGDFRELFQKLIDGEVDIMGDLTMTDERKQLISYSMYQQGKESFYLYINGMDSGINVSDYTSINGKRIGVSQGSYQEDLWTKWCQENNIKCEVIEFSSLAERQAALNNGTIDGTIGNYMFGKTEVTRNWKSVLKIGDAPYYFGVNKNKTEILQQLNIAQAKILSENPYYTEELSTRYMQEGNFSITQLSNDEAEWLKENGDQIKVGCLDGYLPISGRDENKTLKGVIPDLLDAIEEEYSDYNVHFEPVVYNDYKEMLADLRANKIDLATPVYGDYWNADQEQIREQMENGGALFMIDIDNFKMINDLLGHKAGDQVIQYFADDLKKIFRAKDVIGRFGGDEFIVFLPGSSWSEAIIKNKVDMMQNSLDEFKKQLDNKEVDCSVSVGVLIINPKENITYSEAFEKVDAALYRAKESGKKTFVIADQ